MLTDKQIEREEAFCEDWYMTRKMGKTPTYADAIAWADKTIIEKVEQWLTKSGRGQLIGGLHRFLEEEL